MIPSSDCPSVCLSPDEVYIYCIVALRIGVWTNTCIQEITEYGDGDKMENTLKLRSSLSDDEKWTNYRITLTPTFCLRASAHVQIVQVEWHSILISHYRGCPTHTGRRHRWEDRCLQRRQIVHRSHPTVRRWLHRLSELYRGVSSSCQTVKQPSLSPISMSTSLQWW